MCRNWSDVVWADGGWRARFWGPEELGPVMTSSVDVSVWSWRLDIKLIKALIKLKEPRSKWFHSPDYVVPGWFWIRDENQESLKKLKNSAVGSNLRSGTMQMWILGKSAAEVRELKLTRPEHWTRTCSWFGSSPVYLFIYCFSPAGSRHSGRTESNRTFGCFYVTRKVRRYEETAKVQLDPSCSSQKDLTGWIISGLNLGNKPFLSTWHQGQTD